VDARRSRCKITRPLDEGESAVLVAAVIGQPGSQALGQRLHRASGGNPLYLLSVLDRLQVAGQLRREGDGRWSGLEELASAPILPVPDEVAALAAPARRLLHAAAVLDQPCAAALLGLVAREAERRSPASRCASGCRRGFA
jgi:hypothetical protein